MFDHFQLHTVPFRCLGRVFSRVALIHISQFDALPGELLHRFGQSLDLGAILFISGGYMQGEQMAQCIDGCMYL